MRNPFKMDPALREAKESLESTLRVKVPRIHLSNEPVNKDAEAEHERTWRGHVVRGTREPRFMRHELAHAIYSEEFPHPGKGGFLDALIKGTDVTPHLNSLFEYIIATESIAYSTNALFGDDVGDKSAVGFLESGRIVALESQAVANMRAGSWDILRKNAAYIGASVGPLAIFGYGQINATCEDSLVLIRARIEPDPLPLRISLMRRPAALTAAVLETYATIISLAEKALCAQTRYDTGEKIAP